MGKDKIWIIIAIIGIVIIAVFLLKGKVATAAESKSGISVFFADENKNPITAQKLSYVYYKDPTQEKLFGGESIAFMRLDFKATNTGATTNTVELVGVELRDNTGKAIETQQITNAFSCILNKPKVIASGESVEWTTSLGDCGSLVWIPTLPLEKYGQPLNFVATFRGTYTFVGIQRSGEIQSELPIWLSNSTIDFGSFNAEFLAPGTGGSVTIEECTDGTSRECARQDGACFGASQTCLDKLWPGCSYTTFKTNNAAYMEPNEYEVSLSSCKDNIDNDCNGLQDKNDIDACPLCAVNFRTNANITVNGDQVNTYKNQWVVVYHNNSMRNFFMGNTVSTTSQSCGGSTYTQQNGNCISTYCKITKTPLADLAVTYKKGNSEANGAIAICENTPTGSKYIRGYEDSPYGCVQGTDDYLFNCRSRFPNAKWNLIDCGMSPCKETCEEY